MLVFCHFNFLPFWVRACKHNNDASPLLFIKSVQIFWSNHEQKRVKITFHRIDRHENEQGQGDSASKTHQSNKNSSLASHVGNYYKGVVFGPWQQDGDI